MRNIIELLFVLLFVFASCSVFAQDQKHSTGAVPNLKLDRSHTIVNTIYNPATIAFGHNSIENATLSMPIPAGTPFTTLGTFNPGAFFASSMIKGGDGNYYLTTNEPALYQFNTGNGAVTLLGAITGTSGDQINGISYNPVNTTYYLISATKFYSFNISTRVATLIGNMGVTGSLFIDLCFNATGVCYAYELTTDAAYTINTSTGVATQLGPLGYDANYGQGMSYDMETSTIYISAFNNGTFTGQLRTMNPTTGGTTLITDWGFNQIAPFALNTQYGPPPTITVTSPNGGEVWTVGSVHNITWTSTSVTNVRIQYSTDSGTTWNNIVASAPAASGSYSWPVPNTPSINCKVKISDVTNNLVNDQSNSTFTISNIIITTPVLVSPANNSTEVPTNPELVWQSATGAETYSLQVSLTSNFGDPTKQFDGIADTSYSLSSLAENSEYYWRVRGVSGTISGDWSDVWKFTTVSTINLNYTVTFPSKGDPSDYQSSDYKIVGLPGRSDMDVKSILTGTQGTDWQVYWDNGQNVDYPNYYEMYDATSPFRFHLGKAYWIIRKGNLNISKTVEAAGLGTDGRAAITLLQNAWNLITNPFTIPVDWDSVKAANGLTNVEVIWTFPNGGWSNSNVLEPYVGYLFDNQEADLIYMVIPYPTSLENPIEKKTDLAIWRVDVELTCGEFFDKTSSFGISEEAMDGRDKLDFRKPRGMGNTPFVYFYHPEWDNGYGFFATDIRSEFDGEQNWDLKVYSALKESENLTFSGIEKIPSDMEIYLVDKDRAKYVNLKQQAEYEFTAVKTISEFQILVGKPELINNKLNGLLPTEYELGNNFPNPFNPTTTIPLSIPQNADIKLIVYNILGQEVRVLFDGTIEPGKYWYQWDGKDNIGQAVPSGIYLYNFVSSTGINFSKKMVLIK